VKHFIIQELVPPPVYHERGDLAWELLDKRLLENLDSLRDQINEPITVNNWHLGGNRTQSGLRQYGMEYYRPYSQHSFGRAADCICHTSADKLRDMIMQGQIVLPHNVTIEMDVDWLHMDVRNSERKVRFFYA